VLDLAAGSGRHTRLFLEAGHRVVAIDRDVTALNLLASERLEIVTADLEDGSPWPIPGLRFSGVVVTNYLHRPLMKRIVDAVAPAGVLIYETFAIGQECFGKPSNPDFLLRPGELLEAVRDKLRVIAFEDLTLDDPRPAVVQRICARLES
jgi:SAM-dependent methyltransferase